MYTGCTIYIQWDKHKTQLLYKKKKKNGTAIDRSEMTNDTKLCTKMCLNK